MTRHDQTNEALLEEAMDWFLRLREPSRSNSDDIRFSSWIGQSLAHQQAWTKACHTWEVLGESVPVNMSAWQSPRRIQPVGRRAIRRRGAIGLGLGAVAACLVALAAGPAVLTRYQADYRTQTAETRRIMLEDGSTVEMSASSAIAVDFSANRRAVRLLSGEAFFNVQPESARPFTVDAGGELDITVVGTAFDVNVTPQVATVQLAHGALNLSSPETGATMKLRPGELASLDRHSGRLSHTSMNVDAMATWRDGKLFVQDVPISTVVAELQRYHPAWITVASSELGTRRITGLYDLSNPDRALEALVSPYGAKVHYLSPYLRFLSFF